MRVVKRQTGCVVKWQATTTEPTPRYIGREKLQIYPPISGFRGACGIFEFWPERSQSLRFAPLATRIVLKTARS